MQFIENGDGIAWGDADHELHGLALRGKIGDLRKTSLEFRVTFLPRGVPDRELPPDLSPQLRAYARRPTIVLYEDDSRVFRLRWRRESDPLEALARICAIERRMRGSIPSWLVAALYCAGQAWQMGVTDEARGGMAAIVAGFLALGLARAELIAGNLDDVAIREMAQQALLARKGDPVRAPDDPWGVARMVWQMSALAWSEDLAEQLVADYIAGGGAWRSAAIAMAPWGVLHRPRLIEPLEDDWPPGEEAASAMLRFWTQRVALRGALLAEAQALYTPWRVNRRWWKAPEKPPEGLPDAELALAMAQRLIAEAKANRQYSEQGIYEAELPSALPLVRWGVKRLRWVCLRAGYQWVSLLGEAGESLSAFRWRGDATKLQELELVMPEWIAPYVHLAVAALWRDLVVAGETVFVYAGKKGEGKGEEGVKDERATREAIAHAERVLCLPRARKISLNKVWPRGIEARAWGDAEDLQTLEARRRALHAVRGHYRKLAAGWRAHEAETRAANYGMPSPPDGYTFVVPHVRGGERGMDEETMVQIRRRVRARGLEALVAALG